MRRLLDGDSPSFAVRACAVALGLLIPAAGRIPGQRAAQDANLVLELGSHQARTTPAHRLQLDVSSGDPEIHRATLAYPAGFAFLGFQATGTAGTLPQYEDTLAPSYALCRAG